MAVDVATQAVGTIADPTNAMPWNDMCELLKADYYLTPEGRQILPWQKRHGCGPADPDDPTLKSNGGGGGLAFQADGAVRALTLLTTGGEDDRRVFKEIACYFRNAIAEHYGRQSRRKHADWELREKLFTRYGLTRRYEWKRGTGPQPSYTDIARKWDTAIVPVPSGRHMLKGAALILNGALYHPFDARTYVLARTVYTSGNRELGKAAVPGDQYTAPLYDPADFIVRERKARFVYA